MEAEKKKVKNKNKNESDELDRQLEIVLEWVRLQIEKRDVPRFVDVLDYAHRVCGFVGLSKKRITQALRLVPSYVMTSTQERQKKRTDRNRPMIVNSLGQIHADIGFFSLTKEYATPVTYRSGFLVCKDTLSRFIFVSVLQKNRKAASMIKAFKDVLVQYRKQYPDQKIKSVGFDREKSVTGNQFQGFLKEKKILFHAFHNTSSKSKMAENAIKLIRKTIARTREGAGKEKRWWKLIQGAVDSLNSKPIRINNKFLKMKGGNFYSPRDVDVENLEHFKKQLEKADSSFYFSQFDIDPRWVKFNLKEGDFVRPKLIATSSEVLGTKRSEVTLEEEIFVVKKLLPYVSRKNTIEKAYVCSGLTSGRQETFQEDEIALTPSPFLES